MGSFIQCRKAKYSHSELQGRIDVAHSLVRAVFALRTLLIGWNRGRSHECERGTHECVRHIGYVTIIPNLRTKLKPPTRYRRFGSKTASPWLRVAKGEESIFQDKGSVKEGCDAARRATYWNRKSLNVSKNFCFCGVCVPSPYIDVYDVN